MAKYGTSGPSQGQNLAYGSSQNALDVIMQLLVDDGAPRRTSRHVMLNRAYSLTGIATCAHKTRTMMTSILYTDYFQLNEVGKAKVQMLLSKNPTPRAQGPRHVPGLELRPIVQGSNANLDRAIYYWQNKMRTDPADDALVAHFRNFVTSWAGATEPKAASDALAELVKMKAEGRGLPALEWSEALNLAARDHCNQLGSLGLRGHFGTDESSPFDRITKYGKPGWWRGENMSYNSDGLAAVTAATVDEVARKIVFNMFIDEGIAGRPNRSRLLNPEFKMVGIYSCAVKDGSSMSVIDYTSTMKENELAKQGIMQEQEENAAGKNGQNNVPIVNPFSPAIEAPKRCSDLPAVSRNDCGFFDAVNEVRTNPSKYIDILKKRELEIS